MALKNVLVTVIIPNAVTNILQMVYFLFASSKWANLKPFVPDPAVSIADLEAPFKIDDDYPLAKIHLARWQDLNDQ